MDRETVSVVIATTTARYPQGYVGRSSPSPLTGKGQLGGGVNDNGAPGTAGMLVQSAVQCRSVKEHALCGRHVGGGGAYPALDRLCDLAFSAPSSPALAGCPWGRDVPSVSLFSSCLHGSKLLGRVASPG